MKFFNRTQDVPVEPRTVRIGMFGTVPVYPKPAVGGRAVDNVPSGTEVTAHEVRGIFTRITASNGSSGWIQTTDIQK